MPILISILLFVAGLVFKAPIAEILINSDYQLFHFIGVYLITSPIVTLLCIIFLSPIILSLTIGIPIVLIILIVPFLYLVMVYILSLFKKDSSLKYELGISLNKYKKFFTNKKQK